MTRKGVVGEVFKIGTIRRRIGRPDITTMYDYAQLGISS